MNATEQRNQRVLKILEKFYQKAISNDVLPNESTYANLLDALFSTETWGYREILLVVIVGMKLNKEYRASSGLYNCNPRAIYEGPIKEFLILKNIPHRKSGPLNIAKATVGLDDNWAKQRRPSKIAEDVVKLVNMLEKPESKTLIDEIAVSLLRRLIQCSKNIVSLAVKHNPISDPEVLYNWCYELITKTPDAGNTPQRIAAYLLKNYHSFFPTGVIVTGGDDRASVTSTTSKKPGDINEELPDGIIRKVYEVTVKHFDLARIRDSYDCVCIYNSQNNTNIREIIVVCRKEDCPNNIKVSELHGYLGSYTYNEIKYYYWDIYEWIANTLQRMTDDARAGFYHELNAYINNINTSENVKKLWKQLHETE